MPQRVGFVTADQVQTLLAKLVVAALSTTIALTTLASASRSASAQSKVRLEIGENDIDLGARTLHFQLTGGAVRRVDVAVFSPDAEPLYTGHEDYEHAAPGARLSVSWPDLGKQGDNFRMELKFTTDTKAWVTFQVVRFYAEVPREEVAFDSGKWEVQADQQSKLEKPLSVLKEAAAKYSALMNVSLYVAGHTDTVGKTSDNQQLSEQRARAIAEWFTKHGLRGMPIYARGFGESLPAIKTPDNVPEPRNRRAQYIVSSFAPPLAGSGTWKRLK